MKKGWFKDILIKVGIFLLELVVETITKKPKQGEIIALSTLRPKQVMFLRNVAKLIEYSTTLPNLELTAGEMWRTAEQQAIYFSKGLSKVRRSKHQDRLAVDLNVFINGVYRTDKEAFKDLAKFWKELNPNNVSGYDWDWDYNHFEMK